jgi:hypothetical protein
MSTPYEMRPSMVLSPDTVLAIGDRTYTIASLAQALSERDEARAELAPSAHLFAPPGPSPAREPIKLPDRCDEDPRQSKNGLLYDKAYNAALRECAAALRAQGLEVAE